MKPAWVPPKERNVAMKISNGGLDSAALPPKTLSGGLAKNFAAELAALNPQPLPPKISAIDKAKSDLDSMSEMGEMESLRLQMAMDRTSKMMSTLSNSLEKVSDTAEGITANLK